MNKKYTASRIEFTPAMKREYTILTPNMAPVQFNLLINVLKYYGYKAELLQNSGRSVVDAGLKYVHNDTCYPALLVIGQFIDALQSGRYNTHKVALLITQTGGGCRASNYIHLLRKALERAGFGYVPVISLNISGLERNSGFKISLGMIRRGLAVLGYGDLLTGAANQIRPYEVTPGQTDALVESWSKRLTAMFNSGRGYSVTAMKRYFSAIACDFAAIPRREETRLKVGVVGEIYVKYSALANNGLEKFLASQGCEVMVPGLIGFMLFKVDNRLEDIRLYGGSGLKYTAVSALMGYLTGIETALIDAMSEAGLRAPMRYYDIRELVSPILGRGCKMGEGWLLTAEMMELIEHGFTNIVCAQPFGCLPNHIVGKGMIRRIRTLRPGANIVPIDYDPGATEVNQENRIKLMLATGREKMAADMARAASGAAAHAGATASHAGAAANKAAPAGTKEDAHAAAASDDAASSGSDTYTASDATATAAAGAVSTGAVPGGERSAAR